MLELFQEKRAELARLIPLPNPEEVQAWLKSRPRGAALLARPALGARLNEGGGTEWFSVSQAGKPSCSFLTLTNAGRGAAGGEAPPGARLAEEIEELRSLVQAWPGEWGLELTGPDPRLAAEAAAAGGLLTWRGGPLETYFSLGRTGSLGALVDTWAYVEGLVQLYGARGIQVHREVQGVRGTALMPPGLSVAVLLIEAALAARGGSREVGLAYTPCGHLVQDGAAIRVLQRMAPAGIKVSVTCLAWPGGALAGFGGKAAAAAWTALTAALGGGARAEVVTLDTAEDSWEEGLERLAAAGGVAQLAREQCRSILPALKQEEELIAAEAGAVLARVEELGAGDLVAGVTGALAEGSLDLPLAPSGVCRGQVLAARDLEGAVRFLDPGCLPLPAAVKEFHREKLARRARAEGREPAVSMVIDDIYALNKGFLVGHPE